MAHQSRVSPAILSLMTEGARHAWTLEDLQADLADEAVRADFSSIFRGAEKLAAAGLVRKVVLEDGRARFELVDAHHDHLHCTRCGELVAVPCLIGSGHFGALERTAGIAIFDHHLVLSGICRDCNPSPGQHGGAA